MVGKTDSAAGWARHLKIGSAIILMGGIGVFFSAGLRSVPKKAVTQSRFASVAEKSDIQNTEALVALRKASAPVRILPLGDSITQGDRDRFSYRYHLWRKLIRADIDFDFVGSMHCNFEGNPVWPDCEGHTFDPDHEGHWAWRADHILNGLPGKREERLSEWLKEYTPDIVLMHLGSNDALQIQSTSSTVEDLKAIIEVLRADNPNVITLLSKVIPTYFIGGTQQIEELNAQIDRIAQDMSTPASPVIVVDQYSGFRAKADTCDWIHPNNRGAKKMAAKWFKALRKILDNRVVDQPARVTLADKAG